MPLRSAFGKGTPVVGNLELLQDLYDSEINFEIAAFWNAGFIVRLGNKSIGFKVQAAASTYGDAVQCLRRLALTQFPDSLFAKKYRQ
jgi:hypothetical protein